MQKTAYNMLISDWSSDVCSSDLHLLSARARDIGGQYRHIGAPVVARDEGAFFGRGRGAARRAFRGTGGGGGARPDRPGTLDFGEARRRSDPRESGGAEPFLHCRGAGDRKSVVVGKCVSVLVDLGVCRSCQKKKSIMIAKT